MERRRPGRSPILPRPSPRPRLPAALALLAAAAAPAAPAAPAAAQDPNIMAAVDSIEHRLVHESFDVLDERGSRFEGDRTSRAVLSFEDGTLMAVKWAPAPRKGEAFNNSPRYEAAVYEIQKMFLDESEYVVPPTVLRAFPLDWYRRLDEDARPTFEDTESVLVALQYWLFSVTDEDVWDRDRFERDSVYARHLANFNILTYLVRHNDANKGNFLISTVPSNPRVFSVDNGLSFLSETSDRGADWRRLRVDRVPAHTVARLREISEESLFHHLETIAQFRVLPDGRLEWTPPEEALSSREGVRQRREVIQLGLTRGEIQGVWHRLRLLLRDVDEGKLETF